LINRGERKLSKRAKMKKNVYVSENLEENPVHTGNFSKLVLPRIKFGVFQDNINSLQGNKNSSCSSALRGENYFEIGKGKKIKVVEVYGDKPIDEVLEAFSKYISQFF
jgi:hypothetical protein